MALILGRAKCSICKEAIADGEPTFGTWGVWLPATDPLSRLCDATLHWSCYAAWPHRERFASSYFDFWVEEERDDICWHRAYLDADVLVTVNPIEPVRSAWVHLRSTGTRTSVKLADWAAWVVGKPTKEEVEHPVFAEALDAAKRRLRVALPTEQFVLDSLDLASKQSAFDRHRAKEEEWEAKRRAERERTKANNAACERLIQIAERDGITCPHCNVASKDFRLVTRANMRSVIICKRCAWTVDPAAY